MRTPLTLILLTLSVSAFAQCAHDDLPNQTFVMGFAPRTTEVYTIPLVFHVMHANGVGNIPDSLIFAMVDDLNEAYEEHNIQFCLSQNDPYKRPHSGINRVNVSEIIPNYMGVSVNGCSLNTGYIELTTLTQIMHWPPQHAYQIYICPFTLVGCSPFGGFAYFPNGMPFDGTYLSLSTFNTAERRKYVVVHEVGHGLALHHTFNNTQDCDSETNCATQGDFVCDTPPHFSPSSANCSNTTCDVDMTNWMDYGWQCANHFTDGQGQRMRSAIQTTVRWQAVNSGACGCPFDFDGDGVVTVNDLMTFLSLFGTIYTTTDMLNFLAVMGCEND